MKFYFFQIILLLFKFSLCDKRILPFSRIKMINDSIYFTLGLSDKDWHLLLSIDSIGADAFVKFSKEHYGENKCDYQIECYKYNIIVNFDNIYSLMNSKKIPGHIGLEYEQADKVQNGIDVECTNEKFNRNEENVEVNIKQSRGEIPIQFKIDSFISRGINSLRKSFRSIINNINNEEIKNDLITNQNFTNLRKELSTMKNEIKNLENQGENIENNILTNIKKINSNLDSEKSLLQNLWKREVIAGMAGAVLVFCLLVLYYICNGSLKSKKILKMSIN